MTVPRSKFAGGDQDYLQGEQYANSDRLAARARLHSKYSTSAVNWLDWVGSHFELFESAAVLDVGCGAGWLWERPDATIPSGASIVLSDYSPGMVDEAVRRVTATARFASVSGRQADAQALPFADASFDRVIANHMLYHLPDPARGVAELARVVRRDGVVIAAANGRRHMQELWQLRGAVFDLSAVDQTIDVFGPETGFIMMRDHFDDVRWLTFNDELHCTDPDDVLAYVCSTPPAERADAEQIQRLRTAIATEFEHGGGTMVIAKDVGCFVCRLPR